MTPVDRDGQAVVSLAEAIRMSHRSESTVRRKLNSEGIKLGATKSRNGWEIPVPVLHALGLLPVTRPVSEGVNLEPVDTEVWNRLQEALRRAEVAEAIAAERLRTIETQERALRLLEAAPSRRRRWWRRSVDG